MTGRTPERTAGGGPVASATGPAPEAGASSGPSRPGEVGRRVWLIAGGIIPFPDPVAVEGGDPGLRSHAELAVLNASDVDAELAMTVYYEDQEPVGPYPLRVPARRVRRVRFNDLIDPEAIRLDRPFGCLLRASTPVVVQFTRQDTRMPGSLALASTMAYPVD